MRARRRPYGTCLSLLTLLFLVLTWAFPQPIFAEKMSDGFVYDSSLPAALVSGTLHASELYEKNSGLILEIPGAARLMTLYLAIERLPADDNITISRLVEDYDSQERLGSRLELKAGDVLPLRFLVLKMLFEDSDAAAIAIAERVAGSAAQFVKEMQKTAEVLGMTQTHFYACDVARAENDSLLPQEIADAIEAYDAYMKEENPEPLQLPEASSRVRTVKTTLKDIARLLTALQNNSRAKAILAVSEELVQVTSGGQAQVVSMRSPSAHFVTLSENRITGSYFHQSNRYSILCSLGTTPEDIPVMTLTVSLRQAGLSQPTLQLYESLDTFYKRSALTLNGESYPGAPEQAANGELFDLIYLDSIDYIHPRTDYYLEPTLEYLGNAPYPIPVQKGAMTGQVVFTLKDGVRIPVRVGSNRDILADNNLISRGLVLMVRNPNLAYTITALALLLSLAFLVIILRESIKLRGWIRLHRIEHKAQEAQAIMFGEKKTLKNK